MSIDWLFIHTKYLVLCYWLLFTVGIYFFLSYVYEAYKKRLKKKLDIGLKYTVLAVSLIILPIVVALFLILNGETTTFIIRIITIYGFSMLFGIISMLIFGQTYKTLPFIVWLDKYQAYVGKQKTPFPRELYSEKIANYQFYIYLFALGLMIVGILYKNKILLQTGSIMLILVALLNLWNILKITFHKTKLKPLK